MKGSLRQRMTRTTAIPLILIAAFVLLGNEEGNGCEIGFGNRGGATLQGGVTLYEFIGEPLFVHAFEFEPYAAHMKVNCVHKTHTHNNAEQMDVSVRIIASDPTVDPDDPPKLNEDGNYAATVLLSWDGAEPEEAKWSRFDNELTPYGYDDELEFLKKLANEHSTLEIATQPVPSFTTYAITFSSHLLRERIDAELAQCAHVMRDDFKKDPRL